MAPRTLTGGWRRRAAALGAAVATLVGSGALASCSLTGPSTYQFTGIFASGQGLFPGSRVQVLGLAQGSVVSVANRGNQVVVRMSLPTSTPVPAGVRAIIVAPELLGQRSVDLEPGYTGGPRLAPGAVIPESRTSVPVETNQILNEITDYLQAIKPKNVHDLVTNLAQDLNGQGQSLNDLINHAAGTISLLAEKGNELGQLNGTLAALTGTLDSRTAGIEALITDYDQVSGVVAQDRTQLDGAVAALSQATTQLASLLDPNVTGLEQDLAALTTTGRSIDRNLASVDLGLQSSVKLFAGAQRAYDPVHQWLNLNNQSAPATPSSVLADEVRDRLAGVCRRILANHSAGLSPQQIQTLQTCGDPASGFFNPILGIVPSLLGSAPGQSIPTPTAQADFVKGLGRIPGLTTAQRRTLAAVRLSPSTPRPVAGSRSRAGYDAYGLPPLGHRPTADGPRLTGGLLHPLISAGQAVASFLGGLF